MSSVQRSTARAWEAGTEHERRRAAEALRVLSERKPESDVASRARDARKDAFRRGGREAADVVWHEALDEGWPNPGGRGIPRRRAPEDWRPAGRTADEGRMRLALARHLYGRYRTPEFLDAMWLNPGQPAPRAPRYRWRTEQAPAARANPDMAYAAWWKAIASGTSLHKSCFAGRAILSRKETHVFLSAPSWCSVRQALWWTRLMATTGQRAAADGIARSRLPDFAGNPGETPDPRWVAAARFLGGLVSDPEGFRGDELDEVLDWVAAMIRGTPGWGIEGRTARSVRRASRDWHKLQARQRAWSRENWTGFPVDEWSSEEGVPGRLGHRRWRMHQIVTGKELAAEGHAQRHCVGSYLDRCRSGSCAIFSLTVSDGSGLPEQRALTVEVSSAWLVVQAKGFANRAPTAAERAALRRWSEANGIR